MFFVQIKMNKVPKKVWKKRSNFVRGKFWKTTVRILYEPCSNMGVRRLFLLEGGATWRPVRGNALPNIVMTFFCHHRLRCAAFAFIKRSNKIPV